VWSPPIGFIVHITYVIFARQFHHKSSCVPFIGKTFGSYFFMSGVCDKWIGNPFNKIKGIGSIVNVFEELSKFCGPQKCNAYLPFFPSEFADNKILITSVKPVFICQSLYGRVRLPLWRADDKWLFNVTFVTIAVRIVTRDVLCTWIHTKTVIHLCGIYRFLNWCVKEGWSVLKSTVTNVTRTT